MLFRSLYPVPGDTRESSVLCDLQGDCDRSFGCIYHDDGDAFVRTCAAHEFPVDRPDGRNLRDIVGVWRVPPVSEKWKLYRVLSILRDPVRIAGGSAGGGGGVIFPAVS